MQHFSLSQHFYGKSPIRKKHCQLAAMGKNVTPASLQCLQDTV
jgi:hypothetical protein